MRKRDNREIVPVGGDQLARGIAQILAQAASPRWQLQDAKARFSELVQRALDGTPQYVSRNGKDAVVVLSYDALMEAIKPKRNLFEFFRDSPLAGSEIDLDRMPGSFRKVDL